MGCDIHLYAERWQAGAQQWVNVPVTLSEFPDRSYRLFGWLAGVRNYSMVGPLVDPRGFPLDASVFVAQEYIDWDMDAHTPSWLTLDELLNVDYDQIVEDRRTTKQIGPRYWDGAALADAGKGQKQTLRDFLGSFFFQGLDHLKEAKVDRLVFWFDN